MTHIYPITHTPQHKHDCEECEYIGSIANYDGYIHHRDGKKDDLIMRFGLNADYYCFDLDKLLGHIAIPTYYDHRIQWIQLYLTHKLK